MAFKSHIIDYLNKYLDKKIQEAENLVSAARESRNNDTKSSAGDKHETGREMMQMEIDKAEIQLVKALNIKHEVSKVDLTRKYDTVDIGALVETTDHTYFISVGIGKIEIDNKEIYVISLASPIGTAMNKSKVGDQITFQGNSFEIKNIQ